MLEVLRAVRDGHISVEQAGRDLRISELKLLESRARLDLGRLSRRGLPEIVLAPNKDCREAAQLVMSVAIEQGQGLISRMTDDHWSALQHEVEGQDVALKRYGTAARVVRAGYAPEAVDARIGLLTAGTSDNAVIQEVQMMADACGVPARSVRDVGVAGLHRLFGPLVDLLEWRTDVLVVAAGMDGVLPGVISGLVALPVIGVPVSNGYGAGGGGEAALMTMLQSCATGLLTMNIDNGIGAGAAAVLIAAQIAAARTERSDPVESLVRALGGHSD